MTYAEYTTCKQDIYCSEFQRVNKLEELKMGYKSVNTYMNVEIDFLEEIFGDDWKRIFDGAWGNRENFLAEYQYEYDEWLENRKDEKEIEENNND